jgi:predicted dehydrogenase
VSDPYKIGIIGAGAMGRNHARVLSSMPNVALTTVFDSDPDRASALAAEFGGQATDSFDHFLGQIQAATVAAPTVAHRDLGLRLMDSGKHVFMEKPIADTVSAARELIQKAAENQLVLAVGHVERFNPVITELEKRLTQPRFIEAHRLSPFPGRSTDIGVVLDLMIHDLEIILHLVKSEIVSIDAAGVAVLTGREDIANARLRFANGCVANITTSRISPERLRKIRVFQSDAYLSLDYMAQSGEMYFKTATGIEKAEIQLEKQEPLRLELQSFIDCAKLGYQPKVGGFEATRALELALEITDLIAQAGPTP